MSTVRHNSTNTPLFPHDTGGHPRHAGELCIFGSSHGVSGVFCVFSLAVASTQDSAVTPTAGSLKPVSCSSGVIEMVSDVRLLKMTATIQWSTIACTCTGVDASPCNGPARRGVGGLLPLGGHPALFGWQDPPGGAALVVSTKTSPAAKSTPMCTARFRYQKRCQ